MLTQHPSCSAATPNIRRNLSGAVEADAHFPGSDLVEALFAMKLFCERARVGPLVARLLVARWNVGGSLVVLDDSGGRQCEATLATY